VDSIDPTPDCEHIYHVVEVDGVFFEAGCQSSHVFHLAEEAFDDVAHCIEVLVVLDRFLRVGL
jgi:hypothetical protein